MTGPPPSISYRTARDSNTIIRYVPKIDITVGIPYDDPVYPNLNNTTEQAWATTEEARNIVSSVVTTGAVSKANSDYGQYTTLPGKLYCQFKEVAGVKALKLRPTTRNVSYSTRQVPVSTAVIVNPMSNEVQGALNTGVDGTSAD